MIHTHTLCVYMYTHYMIPTIATCSLALGGQFPKSFLQQLIKAATAFATGLHLTATSTLLA